MSDSAADQDLIRQGIQLGQTYFPPAVGRGVFAATTITATLNPSPRAGTTASASGHHNTVRDCHVLSLTSGAPIAALSTLEGQAFGASPGATYSLAWLAVEKATQRNLGTLSLFWSPGGTWQAGFSSAFGIALDQFYSAFEADRRDYRAPSATACSF